MEQTKKPQFQIGDVVDYDDSFVVSADSDLSDEEWFKPGCTGIIFDLWEEPDPNREDPYAFGIKWFGEDEGISQHFTHEIALCEGMKNKELCSKCEYSDLCPYLPEIVRCDISEFGQLRGEGKVDYDICKQRKCIRLGICLTNRWL